jgi:hypothetical protein
VSEDGRIVGGEEWQGKVYDREEWKKVLRTARNQRILHMPNELDTTSNLKLNTLTEPINNIHYAVYLAAF